MSFDGTVTLGNILTIGALVLGIVSAVVALNRWQVRTEERLRRVEEEKVSKADCARGHAEVVTRTFCTAQHDRTNTALEKLTEEFGEMALTVQRLLTNQEWVMAAVKTIHAGANPHPQPLPPDPRHREDRDSWEPQEE